MSTEYKLAKALGLILPLAKGYAHQNRVGSNQAYIENAEAALADYTVNGSSHDALVTAAAQIFVELTSDIDVVCVPKAAFDALRAALAMTSIEGGL